MKPSLKEWPKDKPDALLIECLSGLSLSAAARIDKMNPKENKTELPDFDKLEDKEFFEFLSEVLIHAHGRIARIREDKGIKDRARRKPNKLKLKDGVLNLLKKHQQLKQDQIADLLVSELKYMTESTGKKWSRSVYQSGIFPLIKENLVYKDDEGYYRKTEQK